MTDSQAITKKDIAYNVHPYTNLALHESQGPLVIDRPLTLVGQAGAVIKGGGSGSIITVSAPRVVLRGLTLQDSGIDLASEDSAIFVDKEGSQVLIEDNRLEGNLIGVYLKGPKNAIVRRQNQSALPNDQSAVRSNFDSSPGN